MLNYLLSRAASLANPRRAANIASITRHELAPISTAQMLHYLIFPRSAAGNPSKNFKRNNRISGLESLSAYRLKLWDEKTKTLVPFNAPS